MSVDLSEAALVDQGLNGCERWEAIGNVRLDDSDHLLGSLIVLNERCIVVLSQSQQLEYLLLLWSNTVETLDSYKEEELLLLGNEDLPLLLSLAQGVDDLLIAALVLVEVFFALFVIIFFVLFGLELSLGSQLLLLFGLLLLPFLPFPYGCWDFLLYLHYALLFIEGLH